MKTVPPCLSLLAPRARRGKRIAKVLSAHSPARSSPGGSQALHHGIRRCVHGPFPQAVRLETAAVTGPAVT
jgi:hypothetical protein